jgi:hypothetical protein
MSVLWLAPMALLGLGLVAVPIAIHLLVRQQNRRVDYPSLRFLRQSQLAAFRWRNIQDALLLACRAAIVAAAVLALAGPVVQTAARSAAYGNRVARAVVVEPGTNPSAAAAESTGAFASKTFTRARLGDAVADAARWLNEQPPASREVVLVGTFRRDTLTRGDLRAVPDSAGIRFVPAGAAVGARDLTLPILISRRGAGESGGVVIEQRQASLAPESTRVTSGAETPAPSDSVRILAAPADQSLADAALRAALAEGMRWRDSSQRVLIAWQGADEDVVQQALSGAVLARMDRPEPISSAVSAVIDAVEAVSADSLATLEPEMVSAEQLRAWSRPPGGVPANARPVDEGDRRWLWAVALALLGAEYWLRRTRTAAAVLDPAAEARVA